MSEMTVERAGKVPLMELTRYFLRLGAMGFGGTNCFLANVNNLEGQAPYVGP